MKLRYLPWPVPACAGLVCGIVMLACGPLTAVPFLLLALVLALSQPRPAAALLIVLLGLTAGLLRQQMWEGQPDPLLDVEPDRPLLMGGVSDGQILDVRWPMAVSLWISPAGSVPAGNVVLTGRIDRPASQRNPGGFDFRSHLTARGVHGQVLVDEITQHEPVTSLRARLRAGQRHGLDGEAAAITEAITLGERSELGELRDVFAAAGLSHLLALSGLHLGVLAGVATRLLRPLGGWHRPLVIALLTGFLLLVGIAPSLLRAALMTVALIVGDWGGSGRPDNWTRLCLAALLTLLWRPVWLFDLSFQLSYLCLVGLLAFGPPLLDRLRSMPWWHPRALLLGGMGASIAAQLPTLSLTASTFGVVPLLSVPVNLLAIPLASLLVPLGLLAAVLGALHPTLALLPNLLTGIVADLLLAVARAGAQLPSVPWGEVLPAGHWFWATGCLALVLAACRLLRPLAVSVVITAALLGSMLTPAAGPPAEFMALDVGQGDAFLLHFRGGPKVLVDAGGSAWSDFDPGERIVVPALRALGINSLDLVVATHADADHIGGLPAVLDSLHVQALAIGVPEPERELYADLMAAAARNSVQVYRLTRGERLLVGGLELMVLNPAANPTGEANEDSLAFNVSWLGRPVLVMPGEVSARTEAILAVAPAPVLSVPHHGSRFSGSDRLLAAVGGQVAVVSVGRNNYGHPHPDVLARLEAHGYAIRTTMNEGAVRIPLATTGSR